MILESILNVTMNIEKLGLIFKDVSHRYEITDTDR